MFPPATLIPYRDDLPARGHPLGMGKGRAVLYENLVYNVDNTEFTDKITFLKPHLEIL
jgi:hypothetical protein